MICTGTALTPTTSAPGMAPFPHLHQDWAHPAATALGLGSSLPHLHGDWAHPCCHIYTWTRHASLRCTAAIGGRAGRREVRSARRRPRRRLGPACAAGRRRYGASPRCAGGSCKQESHSSRSGSIRLERACPSVCSCRNQSAARAAAKRRIAGIPVACLSCIKTGTGLTPAHVCAKAGLAASASAPGLGSSLPPLHRDVTRLAAATFWLPRDWLGSAFQRGVPGRALGGRAQGPLHQRPGRVRPARAAARARA